MDQVIVISNKWHYQDDFSEFLYFPFFYPRTVTMKLLVLLNEVIFQGNLNEHFSPLMMPFISFHF